MNIGSSKSGAVKIWLIGYMGSGKSTLAAKVENVLGIKAIDIDHQVEQKTSLSIAAIFMKHGASYFRVLERQVALQVAHSTEDLIIATGGGLPVYSFRTEEMKSSGQVYFIKSDPEQLWKRVKSDKSRPLVLAGKTAFLKRYEERLPVYMQADYIFDVNEMSQEDMIRSINKSVNEQQNE